MFSGCQWMAKVPNAAEILPKIWTAWVGRMNVTDRQTTDRQMDGRQHIANVNSRVSGFFLCLFWSHRHAHRSHLWTYFDDLYIVWRLSAQGCTFWGFRWYPFPFRGSNPPKRQFLEREWHFQAKRAKSKIVHIIETPVPIPTKCCTTITTIKYSSWAVQTRPKQNPRWRMATILKKDKSPYPSNGLAN